MHSWTQETMTKTIHFHWENRFAEQNGNWAAEREFGVSESNVRLVISDGGHWGAFRKRSNEQLQVQQLQQIIVYIHLYTSVPADSWQQAQIPHGERRSNLNNWTISKGVNNWYKYRWCHVYQNDPWNAFKEVVMTADFLSALFNKDSHITYFWWNRRSADSWCPLCLKWSVK